MKKILIPIDGSEYSDRAMEQGKELAKAFRSKVVLMNVIHVAAMVTGIGPGARPGADFMKKLVLDVQAESDELLKKGKESFGDMSGMVETFTTIGNPADLIIKYAEENDVDFLVMGSHGMGAILNRLLTGSVTSKVLHHVQKPILVVK